MGSGTGWERDGGIRDVHISTPPIAHVCAELQSRFIPLGRQISFLVKLRFSRRRQIKPKLLFISWHLVKCPGNTTPARLGEMWPRDPLSLTYSVEAYRKHKGGDCDWCRRSVSGGRGCSPGEKKEQGAGNSQRWKDMQTQTGTHARARAHTHTRTHDDRDDWSVVSVKPQIKSFSVCEQEDI